MAHPRNKAERKRLQDTKAKRRADYLKARFDLDADQVRSKVLGHEQLHTRDRNCGYEKPLDKAPDFNFED